MIIYNVYKYGAKRSIHVSVFQRCQGIDGIIIDLVKLLTII
jgi:hypothetical protein